MNVIKQQESLGRVAELPAFGIHASKEGSPRRPPPVVTYQPVEVAAEYGCVDWYQYEVKADAEETRH